MSNKRIIKQDNNELIISNLIDAITNPESLSRSESSPSYTFTKFISSIKLKDKDFYIGNYLIKKTLGQGTFGKVKMGIYLPTGEKVAIKILEKDAITENEIKVLVKREFDIVVKFNHPNVIFVEEIFETNYHYYCVMEYCSGGDLYNYIIKKRKLNDDEAAFFYFQLINGLEYIHSLGVFHRDLKPENLLLTKAKILKINDFGLSNYFKEGQKELLSTQCGSLSYSSPEMIRGQKYNGFKIDIWATGIILYAMLCGYLPFEDNNKDILFKKILECNIFFPDHIKKDAKDLIEKILVIDPEKRIDIKNIKSHPYYLKGKEIYRNRFNIDGNIDYEKQLNEIEKSFEQFKDNEKEKTKNLIFKKFENNKDIKVEKSIDGEENNKIQKNNLEQENNKNNLIGRFKKNNENNIVEKIFNNLEEREKSKKKSQNKKAKDHIKKKSIYIKTNEFSFNLDNNGKIKTTIENKLKSREKSHENKISKIKDKILNNNKLRNLLAKRTYENASLKINSLFNIKNTKKIKLKYKKIIKRKNNFTESLNKRQLSMYNNDIDIERLPNKLKISSNFPKTTSENKDKKTIEINNKNDIKLKSLENKNRYLLRSSQNLNKNRDWNNIFNFNFNKGRNLRYKNSKKEINLNKLKKYKLDDKNRLTISSHISLREDIIKSGEKIKIIKKLKGIKIDINDNSKSTNKSKIKKEANHNNNSKTILNDKNNIKYFSKNTKNKKVYDYDYLGNSKTIKSNESLPLHKKIKRIIINTEKKLKNQNKKLIINLKNNQIQLNFKNNIFYKENYIKTKIKNKNNYTMQNLNKIINNNNKTEIINNKINITNDNNIMNKNNKNNFGYNNILYYKNNNIYLNYINKQDREILIKKINLNQRSIISKEDNSFYKHFLKKSIDIEKTNSPNLSINHDFNKNNYLTNKKIKKESNTSKIKNSTNIFIDCNALNTEQSLPLLYKKRIMKIKNNNIMKTIIPFSSYNSLEVLTKKNHNENNHSSINKMKKRKIICINYKKKSKKN